MISILTKKAASMRYVVLWGICSISCIMHAFPPINLFKPSDRPMQPEPLPCWSSQFTIGYEGALKVKGFRDDDNDCQQICIHASNDIKKKTNVLHIYGAEQNGLAALKGFDSVTKPGQLSQLFNINDENGTQGFFRPCGEYKIPMNLMLSQRFYFNHGLHFGLHLPVYSMELKNVSWQKLNGSVTGEQNLEDDLLRSIREVAGLNVCGWKRTGIGDLIAQLVWMRDYPQAKPLLENVRVQARLGAVFPSGKKTAPDDIVAFPFGNDGSWGIQFAGGIDLDFCWALRGGVDVEFIYLFGNERCRRIKTVCNQTDLLFLTKLPVFREFGLNQQYNIYLETCNLFRSGLSLKANYQFLKQNEDRLFAFSDRYDTEIINSSENVQDWTAHSLILMARYDISHHFEEKRWYEPTLTGWFKWGFNGKRALLANTLGVQLSINF